MDHSISQKILWHKLVRRTNTLRPRKRNAVPCISQQRHTITPHRMPLTGVLCWPVTGTGKKHGWVLLPAARSLQSSRAEMGVKCRLQSRHLKDVPFLPKASRLSSHDAGRRQPWYCPPPSRPCGKGSTTQGRAWCLLTGRKCFQHLRPGPLGFPGRRVPATGWFSSHLNLVCPGIQVWMCRRRSP